MLSSKIEENIQIHKITREKYILPKKIILLTQLARIILIRLSMIKMFIEPHATKKNDQVGEA